MNYCENFLRTVDRTGLRPTAPPFIPVEGTTPETAAASGSSEGSTLSSHGPGAENPASTAMQQPAPFDEKGTWDAYHTQFEMLARINKWND